jgi:hypothetical protein
MTVATSNIDSKRSAQIPAIPPITLTVDSNRRYLSTLKFNEPVDIQLLKNLLMIEGILSTANFTGGLKTRIVNQRTQMRTLIKAYDAIVRVIKVTYQSANDGACTYGRNFPAGGATLVRCPKTSVVTCFTHCGLPSTLTTLTQRSSCRF